MSSSNKIGRTDDEVGVSTVFRITVYIQVSNDCVRLLYTEEHIE